MKNCDCVWEKWFQRIPQELFILVNVPVPNNMTREAIEALVEEDVTDAGEDEHAEDVDEAEEGDEKEEEGKVETKVGLAALAKVRSCC